MPFKFTLGQVVYSTISESYRRITGLVTRGPNNYNYYLLAPRYIGDSESLPTIETNLRTLTPQECGIQMKGIPEK